MRDSEVIERERERVKSADNSGLSTFHLPQHYYLATQLVRSELFYLVSLVACFRLTIHCITVLF